MRFHLVTLFPSAFESYLGESIIARAHASKLCDVEFYNPRDFLADPKKDRVDGRPYGGGPGMVMQVAPVLAAATAALTKAAKKKGKTKVIMFSPSGKQFTNAYAKNLLKKYDDVVFLCGRYEGIDARVKKILKAEEVSVGPYVLTGGELPAMVVMDAAVRHIPGVLGNPDSIEDSRVSSSDVYSRPEVFEYQKKKYRVPKVLLSGNHKEIEAWKEKKLSTKGFDQKQ